MSNPRDKTFEEKFYNPDVPLPPRPVSPEPYRQDGGRITDPMFGPEIGTRSQTQPHFIDNQKKKIATSNMYGSEDPETDALSARLDMSKNIDININLKVTNDTGFQELFFENEANPHIATIQLTHGNFVEWKTAKMILQLHVPPNPVTASWAGRTRYGLQLPGHEMHLFSKIEVITGTNRLNVGAFDHEFSAMFQNRVETGNLCKRTFPNRAEEIAMYRKFGLVNDFNAKLTPKPYLCNVRCPVKNEWEPGHDTVLDYMLNLNNYVVFNQNGSLDRTIALPPCFLHSFFDNQLVPGIPIQIKLTFTQNLLEWLIPIAVIPTSYNGLLAAAVLCRQYDHNVQRLRGNGLNNVRSNTFNTEYILAQYDSEHPRDPDNQWANTFYPPFLRDPDPGRSTDDVFPDGASTCTWPWRYLYYMQENEHAQMLIGDHLFPTPMLQSCKTSPLWDASNTGARIEIDKNASRMLMKTQILSTRIQTGQNALLATDSVGISVQQWETSSFNVAPGLSEYQIPQYNQNPRPDLIMIGFRPKHAGTQGWMPDYNGEGVGDVVVDSIETHNIANSTGVPKSACNGVQSGLTSDRTGQFVGIPSVDEIIKPRPRDYTLQELTRMDISLKEYSVNKFTADDKLPLNWRFCELHNVRQFIHSKPFIGPDQTEYRNCAGSRIYPLNSGYRFNGRPLIEFPVSATSYYGDKFTPVSVSAPAPVYPKPPDPDHDDELMGDSITSEPVTRSVPSTSVLEYMDDGSTRIKKSSEGLKKIPKDSKKRKLPAKVLKKQGPQLSDIVPNFGPKKSARFMPGINVPGLGEDYQEPREVMQFGQLGIPYPLKRNEFDAQTLWGAKDITEPPRQPGYLIGQMDCATIRDNPIEFCRENLMSTQVTEVDCESSIGYNVLKRSAQGVWMNGRDIRFQDANFFDDPQWWSSRSNARIIKDPAPRDGYTPKGFQTGPTDFAMWGSFGLNRDKWGCQIGWGPHLVDPTSPINCIWSQATTRDVSRGQEPESNTKETESASIYMLGPCDNGAASYSEHGFVTIRTPNVYEYVMDITRMRTMIVTYNWPSMQAVLADDATYA